MGAERPHNRRVEPSIPASGVSCNRLINNNKIGLFGRAPGFVDPLFDLAEFALAFVRRRRPAGKTEVHDSTGVMARAAPCPPSRRRVLA